MDNNAVATLAGFNLEAQAKKACVDRFRVRLCVGEDHRPRWFVGMGGPRRWTIGKHAVELRKRLGEDHAGGLPAVPFFVVNGPCVLVALQTP